METPDEVRRQIEIGAPRERVWSALTRPEELLRWFPTEQAHLDLRPGGVAGFVSEESADEAVVEVVEPPVRFVFRWRPAGLDRPYTTVSFTLEETRDGTRLTLVESGFASLADQIALQSLEGNDAGWRDELEELKAYLEAA
ncbi:MAG TPA: SRPBCC domain-containing protein [Actinomycetota bacterium]|nr:SRPBCC domain-containing protein [Actinomycetota bacterium]